MFFLPIVLGVIFGVILFMFTFVAQKRSGKYYLASIVTFLASIAVTVYGLIVVGGFEGMAYGLLGIGFLFVAIIGTISLPLILRKAKKKEFNTKDKVYLFLLPALFFGIVLSMAYFSEEHWVIEEGTIPVSEADEAGYTTSTILEGRKMIYLTLGEDHAGGNIEIKDVSQWGSTDVIVEITEGGNPREVPYIKIGVDEIIVPLKVETTDGVMIQSLDNE